MISYVWDTIVGHQRVTDVGIFGEVFVRNSEVLNVDGVNLI